LFLKFLFFPSGSLFRTFPPTLHFASVFFFWGRPTDKKSPLFAAPSVLVFFHALPPTSLFFWLLSTVSLQGRNAAENIFIFVPDPLPAIPFNPPTPFHRIAYPPHRGAPHSRQEALPFSHARVFFLLRFFFGFFFSEPAPTPSPMSIFLRRGSRFLETFSERPPTPFVPLPYPPPPPVVGRCCEQNILVIASFSHDLFFFY